MTEYQREYGWYLTGCSRLGQAPLSEADFIAAWQEFEAHAEKLKAALSEGIVDSLDSEKRAEMQERYKHSSFVRAVLVGMSEDQQST